jgi:hypothetical protein
MSIWKSDTALNKKLLWTKNLCQILLIRQIYNYWFDANITYSNYIKFTSGFGLSSGFCSQLETPDKNRTPAGLLTKFYTKITSICNFLSKYYFQNIVHIFPCLKQIKHFFFLPNNQKSGTSKKISWASKTRTLFCPKVRKVVRENSTCRFGTFLSVYKMHYNEREKKHH